MPYFYAITAPYLTVITGGRCHFGPSLNPDVCVFVFNVLPTVEVICYMETGPSLYRTKV